MIVLLSWYRQLSGVAVPRGVCVMGDLICPGSINISGQYIEHSTIYSNVRKQYAHYNRRAGPVMTCEGKENWNKKRIEPMFQHTQTKNLRNALKKASADFRSDVVTAPTEEMMQVGYSQHILDCSIICENLGYPGCLCWRRYLRHGRRFFRQCPSRQAC